MDRAQRLPGRIAEYGNHNAEETDVLPSGSIRLALQSANAVNAEPTSGVVRNPNCGNNCSWPATSEIPFGSISDFQQERQVILGLSAHQLLKDVIKDLDSNAAKCANMKSVDKARSRVIREEPQPKGPRSISDA